jgi:hypothetical protein
MSETHYEHLARVFPVSDPILVNRRCAKIIRFSPGAWTAARTHYARVVMRLRMLLLRIAIIDSRLSQRFIDSKGRPLSNSMCEYVVQQQQINHARIGRWYQIADKFIGPDAATEMFDDIRRRYC